MLNPIQICHKCPKRQRDCNGACACLADPERRDIIDIATAHDCPENRFLAARMPPPAPIDPDFDPETERLRLKAGGCCGSPAKT